MENAGKDAEASLSECGVTFAGTESSDKTVSYTEAGKLQIRLKKAAAGRIFMERETQKREYLFLSFPGEKQPVWKRCKRDGKWDKEQAEQYSHRLCNRGRYISLCICPAGRDEGTIGYLWLRRL